MPIPLAQETARPRLRSGLPWLWLLAGLLFAGSAVFAIRSFYPADETAFDQFWQPAIKSPIPVIVYTGTNVVYRFNQEFLERYRRLHHLENTGPEFAVDLKSAWPLDARDLKTSSNAYVTTGDVTACVAITSMLAQRAKPYQLRYAEDISPGDLHSAPTVLIGAFNNSWTLNVTKPLRFTFYEGDTIRDRYDKNRSWTVSVRSNGSTTDDYAVVSRLLNVDGRAIIMTAAGIGQYCTQAASEFLSSPQKINAFAQSAPENWNHKNLQIVIHFKVVDDVPASVDIVAVHYW